MPIKPELFVGRVVRRRVAQGSKSDREAVVLDTGGDELVLRRRGGNAFADPVLDELVGRRVKGHGRRTGYTLILDDWTELDD
jgi:hypothetical protein